jgi:serine/threonine protein kinase/tetratricopeptide (TPR) repeat protein
MDWLRGPAAEASLNAPQSDNEVVFHTARNISDADRRREYVREACVGDEARIAFVEALLAAAAGPDSLLDRPAGNDEEATSDQTPTESVGSAIGPYKLVEAIGEGGMGTVWMAQQTQPVKRLVAVKLIKAGMDSRQVLARFEAERQALALMDHPNIARVLDGGTTTGGRPYFVMDLVKGVPITRFCDEHRLTPQQRLELFIPVCQAVQHAHQKGIIHRDLKPNNVLVALCDGKPVPKVIDFGVAKAAGQSLTDKTLVTGFGAIVGTLEYMSPEQAEINQLDIDTRSDIYALGVLLYELLAGSPPFSRKELERAGVLEMLRVIREKEPSKPSLKLSTAEGLPTLAANRGTEPAKLTKLVRGELDWIVMKALDKDRNRRYETANGFAMDVQRYLVGEPVLAAPASQWYRLRKLMRRHRGPVLGSGVILLTLIGGITGTTLGLLQAQNNAKQARDQRDAKDSALKAERQAREDEAKARQQAFAALRSMTEDVVERKFTQGVVLTEDDRAFMRGVIAQYDAFAAIQGDDTDSQALRAEGRLRIGNMRRTLGELREAEKDYDQALSILKQLAADFPSQSQLRRELALTHNNRGLLLKTMGRPIEAEKSHTDTLDLRKQLAAEFPTRPEYRQDVAASYNNLAIVFTDTNRPKEAEKAHSDALAIMKQLAADYPNQPGFRQELARSHCILGNMFRVSYRFKEAETAYTEAVAILKQLATELPRQPRIQYELAMNYDNLGALIQLTRRKDRLKESELAHVEALAIFKQLAVDFPTRPEYRQDLALSCNNLASLLSESGRLKEAEKAYLDALAVYRQLAADFPNQADIRNSLASSYGNLAMVCNRNRDFKAAKTYLEEAIPHYQAALKANPRNPMYREFFRNGMKSLIAANAGLQDEAAALEAARKLRDFGWDPPGDAHSAAHGLADCILIVEKELLEAAKRRAAMQFYSDEAMNMLRDAVGKDWKNAALYLARDPSFAPLRQRDDFKKLQAEVEASANKEKK